MSALIEAKAEVSFTGGRFLVRLPNGVAFSFPIAGNRRFERATPEQLVHVEVDGEGLHWPGIDEDLSFAGLLRGDWGQHVRTPGRIPRRGGAASAKPLRKRKAPARNAPARGNAIARKGRKENEETAK